MTQPFIPAHAPQGTVLFGIVVAHYLAWLEHRKAMGKPVSRLVRREFDAFLRCGDPAFGYAVLGCRCGFTRAIASSCKGRALCPYCLSRREQYLTRRLVDGIFGELAVRHWVLCLPPALRYTLGYNPAALTSTLQAFVDSIFRVLRWKAKRELGLGSVKVVHPAAVSSIHRCSCNLDTNVHFHVLAPNGVFIQRMAGGAVEFYAVSLDDKDIEAVALDACRRTCRGLKRLGHWSWVSGRLSGKVVEGHLTFGRIAQQAKFFGECARFGEGGVAPRNGAYAFHVNADHVVEAGDRQGLEELVRYVLAPPITDAQLSIEPNGDIRIRMKRQRHDGDDEEVIPPFVFLDRLAALVPRRRSNAIRYHGAYGSNAAIRNEVVPGRPLPGDPADVPQDEATADERLAHVLLNARHHADRTCPQCLRTLQLVAVITRRFQYRKPGWIPPNLAGFPRVQDRIGQRSGDR